MSSTEIGVSEPHGFCCCGTFCDIGRGEVSYEQ